MGLRIFLTGVSGYLGSVLAERFAREPETEGITGIDLATPTTPLPPKVEFVKMDIRSPGLTAAMAGHEVVVHTAFIVKWMAKMPATVRDDLNLNGARNVARAAAANKVRRFIHASSMAAYDPYLVRGETGVTEDFPIVESDSFFYYSDGKAAAERALKEVLEPSNVLLTLFRPIYIVGPYNRGTVEGFRQNTVKFPRRDPRMQFVHEEDVASAFLQAVRTDMPGAYNVVPDDFIRMSEVWKIIGARFVPTVPLWMARLVTTVRWRYFDSPTHPSWVEAALADFIGSNAKLRATGWKPRYGSAEALNTAL